MERMKTASGKEFDCDYVSTMPSPARAYIRVRGVPIGTVATVFSDPEETRQLQFGAETIEGHTNLIALVPEGNAIRIVLGKEIS